jgi:hypothetical protein
MIVRTAWTMPYPPEELWPLLCESRLSLKPRNPVFFLGTPRPSSCRLPDSPGEVGATRQCVSEQGTVAQRITDWQPHRRLAFHMESTDLGFHRFVAELGDVFDLERAGSGTRVVRTTRVIVRGPRRFVFYPALWVGLKSVHRFVFSDWAAR